MTPDNMQHRVTELETRVNIMEDRQDNLDKLVTSVVSMTKEQEHIKADVTEIKKNVKIEGDTDV